MSSTDEITVAALGAREAVARVQAGELTAAALVDACLEKIRALDPTIHAWAHLDGEGARAAA
jgi:Asp-tRNA(Asn)/Glu-tRNA(Gln) amidotransferase A subunit family amidase